VLELTWVSDSDGSRTRLVKIKDFPNLYADQAVNVGTSDRPKMVTIDKIWFTSPGRNTYRSFGYWGPKETVPAGHLNLWPGFAIEPREGEWKQLEWFLLNIACSGDGRVYERLLKAIAWKFQNPTLATEVAIVMLGPQGVGIHIEMPLNAGLIDFLLLVMNCPDAPMLMRMDAAKIAAALARAT
jgi:hypothetical protein